MSDVLISCNGAVATLTLNRPQARNAYTDELKDAVIEGLDALECDTDVRVVIVTGAGPSFSAGGDLKAMQERSGMFAGDPAELRTNYRFGLQQVTRRFQTFEKPVIAAINGGAIGAGLGLALNCDIRIAAADAKLGATFAKIGLIPGDGSGYLLARAIGFPRALELILTARILDAPQALAIGLVTEVVAPDALLARAGEIAAEIAALPPKGVQLAKAHLYRTVHGDLETSLQLAAAFQGLAQSSQEHVDAVEALLAGLKR